MVNLLLTNSDYQGEFPEYEDGVFTKMRYTERYCDFFVVVGGSCSCNDSNNFSVLGSNRSKY